MGIFAKYQPVYAAHGIPTFPTEGKKPAVSGYQTIGSRLSGQLPLKFPEAEALAFVAGTRTRVTVVDIDSPNDQLLNDTLKRFGETPIMVRSPSGGCHLWTCPENVESTN